MNKIKKLICGLLAICMIVTGITIIPQTVQAATASGTDGEIQWQIKGDTLTLSAVKGTEGRMNDYSYENQAPWTTTAKASNVKNIMIADGVTELVSEVFVGYADTKLNNIKSMTIAGSVKTIPSMFCDTIHIETVILENGVESVENNAFFLTNTENLVVGKSVKQLDWDNFTGGAYIESLRGTMLQNVYGYSNSVVESFVDLWNGGSYYGSDGDGNSPADYELVDGNSDMENLTNPSVKFIALDKKSTLSKAKATSSISIKKGKSKSIKVTLPAGFHQVTKYSGNPADVKVTFKSSNKKIATVSSTGKVTGKKKGTAKITVTMQIINGAKKTATTKVTVK